ncbi:MAG TPA: HAD hydrolase-like protein [Polyangia bacterium]|jgi:phosphoglycolate phosphatase-like HAD superfamily hydrolase|nr:HAD hydrolase-like protein [Polyangia bacterium]
MASEDPQHKLKQFQPTKKFFVGIDSDGCAFNSMEVKHNDCFSVALVREYGLAAVSRQVHESWDFVNLYSQNRGCNRFKAILFVLDHLKEMPRVKLAGVKVPDLVATRAWVKSDNNLSNARLKEVAGAATGDAKVELDKLMTWSKLVNKFVEETVHNLPPFPGLRLALPKLNEQADVLVVSATPAEALVREWAEHGIDKFVALIAGQEMGSKTEHLTLAAKGKYGADQVLMIGDAPGDLKAARDVGALFYPINPGSEEKSWERFVDEGIGRFFSRTYAGAYEASLIDEFMKLLPHNPPWQIA